MDTGYLYLSIVCKLTVTIQDKDRHDYGRLTEIICYKLKGLSFFQGKAQECRISYLGLLCALRHCWFNHLTVSSDMQCGHVRKCAEGKGAQGIAVCSKICSQSYLLPACFFPLAAPDPTAQLSLSQCHCGANVCENLWLLKQSCWLPITADLDIWRKYW